MRLADVTALALCAVLIAGCGLFDPKPDDEIFYLALLSDPRWGTNPDAPIVGLPATLFTYYNSMAGDYAREDLIEGKLAVSGSRYRLNLTYVTIDNATEQETARRSASVSGALGDSALSEGRDVVWMSEITFPLCRDCSDFTLHNLRFVGGDRITRASLSVSNEHAAAPLP